MTRAMKDSGVEWIGKIPENWSVLKAKYVIMQNDGGVWGDEPIEGLENKIVLRSTEQTIDGKWNIFEPATRYLNNVPYKAAKIKKGDLLITKSSGSSLHIGKTTLADEYFDTHECYYSNFLQRIHPNNKILAQYLWYIYNSPISREQFVYHQNSTIGIGNINSTDIENIIVPLPKKEEQYAIITYLDKRCGEIDAITAKIKEQINTLEEYKKSVISETVTKGLNPNTPMKDSGIEWIGKIPANWEVHPIYGYFTERKHKNSLGREDNLLSLSYGKIIRKDINTNGGLLPESFNTYNIIEACDIIIRPTDLQNDKRSLRTGLSHEHGIITSAYIALRPNKGVNSRYFHYLLHTYDVQKVFYNMGNGVRQGLNYSEFAKLMVFAPSPTEQNEIADYLDSQCSQVEEAIADKQKQIETLEEYKKTLIYEYVTGKKEVA